MPGGDGFWQPLPTGGGAASLDDLSDVDVATTPPTDGQALVYDDASGLWVPGTVSGGGGSSGGLLASVTYLPASVATVAATSATFVDVDATNLAITFTVPASGAVIVRLTARAVVGGGNAISWNLREGASDVADTATLVLYSNSSVLSTRGMHAVKVAGLAPGASKTYKWGHARTIGGSTAQTEFSGSYSGQGLMEVWAA